MKRFWALGWIFFPLVAWAQGKVAAIISRDNFYNKWSTRWEREVFSRWAEGQGLNYEDVSGSDSVERIFQNLDRYSMIIVSTNALRDGRGYPQLFDQYKEDIKRWVENGGRLVVFGEYAGTTNPFFSGIRTDAYKWLEVLGIGRGPRRRGRDIGYLKSDDPVFEGITAEDLENSYFAWANYWSTLRIVEGHEYADRWEILAKNRRGDILMARAKIGRGLALVMSWEPGYAQGAFETLLNNTFTYARSYKSRAVPAGGLGEASLAGLLLFLWLLQRERRLVSRRGGKGNLSIGPLKNETCKRG